MHDPEKSDSGRVAAKPTNKAGRPAAEPVEPRPGTKGNADQHSTHRTQSRVRDPGAGPRTGSRKAKEEGGSSPRSSTTSMPTRSGRRFTRLSAKPPPAWTA
jgi:hypothetical protein